MNSSDHLASNRLVLFLWLMEKQVMLLFTLFTFEFRRTRGSVVILLQAFETTLFAFCNLETFPHRQSLKFGAYMWILLGFANLFPFERG